MSSGYLVRIYVRVNVREDKVIRTNELYTRYKTIRGSYVHIYLRTHHLRLYFVTQVSMTPYGSFTLIECEYRNRISPTNYFKSLSSSLIKAHLRAV